MNFDKLSRVALKRTLNGMEIVKGTSTGALEVFEKKKRKEKKGRDQGGQGQRKVQI